MTKSPELSVDAVEFKPGVVNHGAQGKDGYNAAQPQAASAEIRSGGEAEEKEDISKWLRRGYWTPDLGWWVPYYVGTLKTFNIRTGYGFLECSQTHQIYDTDVYIHRSQIPLPWHIGQQVEFAVTVNNRAQPQAQDVMWLPMSAALVEANRKNKKPDPQSQKQKGQNERHLGTLKSYSVSQGYGFITSEPMLEKHSCDVYLDRGQLPQSGEWRPGQVVEFEAAYNKRGQPQARAVNWDPISHVYRDSNGQAPAVDMSGLRDLNKVMGLLRVGDMTAAVNASIGFQAQADSVIDYISFVLERLGSPSRELAEALVDATPINLITSVTRMLANDMIDPLRIPTAVSWCEVTLPFLALRDLGDEKAPRKLDNHIGLVRSYLEKASASQLVMDRSLYQGILKQVHELGAP